MGRHKVPRWWRKSQDNETRTPHELGILAIKRAVAAQTWDELTEQARNEDNRNSQRRGNQT